MVTLSPSAYVVLGLLDEYGDATPYALDRTIRQSVGNFWSFPRSQLYAEAARLVRLGLVAEEREESGRRRRSLSITPAGHTEFTAWLTRPSTNPTDIRDDGLLRLFFHPADRSDSDDVRALAAEQAKVHRHKLAQYITIATTTAELQGGTPQAAALELGLRFERMTIAFWDEIAGSGSAAVTANWGGTP